MKYWMKMIGTSGNPCDRGYTRTYVDFARRPRRIRSGDFMVLYAVGGSKCAFALVQVTSDIYDNEQERWPYRVNIEYSINLPVSCGVHIDKISTPAGRNLLLCVPRASYFQLQPEEYERAKSELEWKDKDKLTELDRALADLEGRVAKAAWKYFDQYETAIKQAAPNACKEPFTVREEEDEDEEKGCWIVKGKVWSMFLMFG